MSEVMLNANKARQLIAEKGLKQNWVIQQMGLSRSIGYVMLRDGLLPKDPELRKAALNKLAQLLGVGVPQILLRLDGQRTA